MNTEIDAALTKEHGVTFVVTPVKRYALNNPTQREEYREAVSAHFDGAPVVLVEEDGRGGGKLHGRDDLVRFLRNVPLEALPWKRWRLSG